MSSVHHKERFLIDHSEPAAPTGIFQSPLCRFCPHRISPLRQLIQSCQGQNRILDLADSRQRYLILCPPPTKSLSQARALLYFYFTHIRTDQSDFLLFAFFFDHPCRLRFLYCAYHRAARFDYPGFYPGNFTQCIAEKAHVIHSHRGQNRK